jgi:hypothetical protein
LQSAATVDPSVPNWPNALQKLSDYCALYLPNHAIDAASLENYAAMFKSLNDRIATAASEKLAINDELSDCERLILGPKP